MDQQAENRLEELIERKKELENNVRVLEELLETPGYKFLRQELDAQLRAQRSADYSAGIDSLDAAFKSAGQRGIIAGLQMASNAPQMVMADLRASILTLSEEIAELNSETSQETSDG